MQNPISSDEIVAIAALVLLAICGALVGFPFLLSLGFTLALGVVFYLIQTGTGPKQRND